MLGSFRYRLAAAIGCLGCLGYVMTFLTIGSLSAAFTPVPRVAARATPAAPAPGPTDVPAAPAVAPAVEPTQVPAAVGPSQPEPQGPLPTAYEWVSIEDVSFAGRARFRVAIVIPAEYSDDQLASVFREAVNRAFRERQAAKALVVFGHSSRDEVSKGADLGSAWASSDRQGWAGDGKFDATPDEGKIYLTIGSAWTSRRQSRLAIERTVPRTSAVSPGVSPLGSACPSSHPIKGNRPDMLYHVPGGAFYARTLPEECFATAADAQAAGYRPSQR